MVASTFTDVLRTTVAALQAAHPERVGEIARAHAAIIEGHVVRVDADNGQVLSRNGSTWYTTNGRCDCQAGAFGKRCRHLSAWKLYQHVQKQYATMQTPAPAPVPVPGLDPCLTRHLVVIQGKPFVRYAGLLDLAHQRGLVALTADWTYNDAELSLAHAVATFQDGRRFEESGDATPANTNRKVAVHFRRVALTRAKARVLRDALGVDLVAVEELADE